MNQKLAALISREVMREEPRTICLETQTRNYDDCDCGYCRPGRLPYPDYPGDMAQAWRVVLKMLSLGWKFHLTISGSESWVEFYHELRHYGYSVTSDVGDTSESICLAALAALGVPYEQEVEHA